MAANKQTNDPFDKFNGRCFNGGMSKMPKTNQCNFK